MTLQTAAAISQAVREGSVSVRDAVAPFRARTELLAERLNTHLWRDEAHLERAILGLEKRLAQGAQLPLAGVPILVKDNIVTSGIPTTCASRLLQGYLPPYDAHVVSRLVEAGALIMGKANLDEFAMGSSSENSAYGATRNPWDSSRVPGGSSGGSAAAVAAALAPVALGSDTGGSVRQPAAFCGVVGLKPTYGRVSRYGLISYASSLDQIGPLTTTVADAALLLEVLGGHDPRDATSADRPVANYHAQLAERRDLTGVKIGRIVNLMGEGLDAGTRAAVDGAIALLGELGATIVDIDLAHLPLSVPAYYVLATAEASSNLARFDGVRFGRRVQERGDGLKALYGKSRGAGFGAEVKQRIMLGTFVLSSGYYESYYGKALAARAAIGADFRAAFAQVDLLVSPTAPTTAFRLGERVADPLAMYLGDVCTIAMNLAGLPAISIPCGFDAAGLPVGLQLVAPHWQEETLLQGAHVYEQATRWAERRKPPL